ncbi:hypothetical protein BV210_09230 [Halorientalis sp. IM1011]|uniref:helix-turn-helix domain-containing protein n=1 Tax=Halorientalis sp. IM1011 TaxID=1932360 RepID=UPI00097CCE3F|nr:helix-turn-helix domain-containing protein [Halorientalis sp. IM1011]AQL42884.1 hypothetical protein BV210_09230 [Halorientalis sp. IM1011]
MAEAERPDDRIIDMLSDDIGKRILTVTDQQAMSAKRLEDHCDASLATVYRRIEDLLEHGLLRERVEIQDDGNHFKRYESNLDRLAVTLEDGTLEIDVDRRDDAPDRFSTIWDAMQLGAE